MGRLAENNKQVVLKNDRFSISIMKHNIFVLLLVSGFFVGLALIVANANTVGWENLSSIWHSVFYVEALLFALQIIILFVCRRENIFNQKVLILGMVLFLYKFSIDPFITISMFLMDDGVFEQYVIYLWGIILVGIILQIMILIRMKNNISEKSDKKPSKKVFWFPVLFLLVSLTGMVVKNGMGEFENLFLIFIGTVIYIGVLIGVCEYIEVAKTIFRKQKPITRTGKKAKK